MPLACILRSIFSPVPVTVAITEPSRQAKPDAQEFNSNANTINRPAVELFWRTTLATPLNACLAKS